MFKDFRTKIKENFTWMLAQADTKLYITDVDRDQLWETYLNSFVDPEEKQSHTCNCCRQFIKNYGHIVFIVNGKVKSIWDIQDDSIYKPAADALNQYVTSAKIKDVFFSEAHVIGTPVSYERTETGSIEWNHFCLDIPNKFVNKGAFSIAAVIGAARDTTNVFKRGLEQITIDATSTVLDLIAQNSLYRGEEFQKVVKDFSIAQKAYAKADDKDLFCHMNAHKSTAVSKIRNMAIGTLLTDLSEGKDIDKAVEAFERMVAPANYKRPEPVVTKKTIEDAQKTLSELGLLDSLERRVATIDDVTINNLLFVDRNVKTASDIFEEIKEDIIVNPRSFSKVEEVSIDDFVTKVLPTASGLELLFENSHTNNLVTLITAAKENVREMFKWNNPFSWSYANEVTDSIKERVKAAGGKIDGVIRFSIRWNDSGNCNNDFDAHAIEPNGTRIYYANYKKPAMTLSTGQLDVDIVHPNGKVAVENITWSNINDMQEGLYSFKVHNFSSFTSTEGFSAELEYNGEIYSFEYGKSVKCGSTVNVVSLMFSKKDGIKIIESLDNTSKPISNTKWNLATNKFHKVSMMMHSPNYWDGTVGNRHTFFMLDNAKHDEKIRGFYNEFLYEDLLKHKRAFEVLGGKIPVKDADKELSGVGFSSTQKNHVICKVKGSFDRVIKINF